MFCTFYVFAEESKAWNEISEITEAYKLDFSWSALRNVSTKDSCFKAPRKSDRKETFFIQIHISPENHFESENALVLAWFSRV